MQSSCIILIMIFIIIIQREDAEMEIRKRNGEMAAFDAEKIRAAMRLAFTATNMEITEQSLNSLLRAVLKRLEEVQQLT